MGADGAGTVVLSGKENDELLHKRVFLTPMRGWESAPDAPEDPKKFSILGGADHDPLGTFAEYAVVDRKEVILTPSHVTDVQMAAWPVAAVTAWRAAIVNGKVQKGHNVLITGIGGGVAVTAMQICLAQGANVFVTSGKPEKIDKAIALGAQGGVSYKDAQWPKQLAALMKSKNVTPSFQCVIDSGGDDIMSQVGSLLASAGRLVCYGMTASPKITFTMREVLRNQRLIGSTMGSRQDLIDATAFLDTHKITPVVSHVLPGLESAEQGFELLQSGEQFGKVVIRISDNQPQSSKL